MKKLSLVYIAVLFTFVFIFSGCTQQQEPTRLIGTDGLVISFGPGAPPPDMYKDDPFDISVLAENKGSADIATGNAAVFIKGVLFEGYDGLQDENPKAEGYYKKSNSLELLGAYKVEEQDKIIAGDLENFDWIRIKYLVPLTYGKDSTTFVAQSCYLYNTEADADICLASRNALLDTTGGAQCEVSGEKDTDNNAAPVQVTRLVEYPKGDGFRAELDIQNVGGGKIYNSDLGTDCLDYERKDNGIVYIDHILLGNTPIETCNWRLDDSGRKYIQLRDGLGRLSCRYDMTGKISGKVEGKISIKLSYGYTKSIYTNMDIKSII